MIYLDHAATSPMGEDLAELIKKELLEDYGNPSSTYSQGRRAKNTINQARTRLAELLGLEEKYFYFTSSATEANNWAIVSQARQARSLGRGQHLVATSLEHSAVRNTLLALEEEGFEVDFVDPVAGEIRLEDFMEASREDTIGWLAMAVNNEVGSILPVEDLGKGAQQAGYFFHTDTVQALGHAYIDFSQLVASSFTASAHKFRGPKGIGFLYYKPFDPAMKLRPFLEGGGQEGGKRSGTENTAFIKAMVYALDQALEGQARNLAHYQNLEKVLYEALDQAGLAYEVNGPQKKVHHIHSLWIKGLAADKALILLDLKGIAVSAGSACSSGSLQKSPVLQAYYPGEEDRWSQSLRISFGEQTKEEEVRILVEELGKLV